MKRRLVIFVKQARPGKVKTRLAAGIGTIAATWWYRHQCEDLFRRLSSPGWELIAAVAPDTALFEQGPWRHADGRMSQGTGDLGDRMGRVFQHFNPHPTVIIGSDIPNITTSKIKSAFELLENKDAVLGPAPDGGYWLIGIKGQTGRSRSLFRNVRWSSEHALSDTIASLGTARIGLTEMLRDVDTADDL